MESRVHNASTLPPATYDHLPRWRGFNLPYRMRKEYRSGHLNKPFTEKTIRLIAELGFNFVRLPVDYRYWIKEDNWNVIDESSDVLTEIDRVVDWGLRYGVHVCINFHTAPGYCVNDRTEEGSRLWTDPEAQDVCAKHWGYFARRYKNIPNKHLSFNLFNEPTRTTPENHLRVVRQIVDSIREEDPKRLITCDGFQFKPAPELADLEVAQSGRGYTPGQITHFQASWWHGAARFSTPTWPLPQARGWLHAPSEHVKSAGTPLVIRLSNAEDMVRRITFPPMQATWQF